jgi:Hemerythrin HHE cation binding domain
MSTISQVQQEFAQQTAIETSLLKCLTDGLHATLAWNASGEEAARKLSTLNFICKSFQRHLERLMMLEEVDGYMDDVLGGSPHLSKAVDALKQDHDWLRTAARRVLWQLERTSAEDQDGLADICDELGQLLDRLDEHSDKEAKLFLEAFDQEEGGEG